MAAAIINFFSSFNFAVCAARISVLCAALFLAGASAQAQVRPDSAPRLVTVGIYISPPFVEENNGRYQGMAVDLWETVAARMGLVSHYNKYPTIRALIEATEAGEIDVAVTNLTITRSRAERVAFTQPWHDAGLRIMVSDDESSNLNSVWGGLSDAGHLRAYLWLAFVIAMATVALTFIDRKFDPDFPRRWRDALAENFYQVISIAVSGKTTRKNLFGWVGRIWQAFWVMGGVAVIAYVTSSVTSVMTTVSLERSVNSLADLPGKTVGVFTGSVAEDYMTRLGIASRPYPDIDAATDALAEGFIAAIVADAPSLEHFAHKYPERQVTVVGRLFHPDKYGFAFPLKSELTRPAMLQILDLHESGDLAELRLRYFGNAP